jgi:hypothetical protein
MSDDIFLIFLFINCPGFWLTLYVVHLNKLELYGSYNPFKPQEYFAH